MAIFLSGCELLLEGGAVESVAVEGTAAEGAAAGAGLRAGATGAGASTALESSAPFEAGASDISVSENLFGVARERGVLSSALDDITARGTRAGRIQMSRSGVLMADGRVIGRLDPATGDIEGPKGVPAGYLNAGDGRIYEFGRNGASQPIAELHGFTIESGTELSINTNGYSGIQSLGSRIYMDVLKMGEDRYLIRLPNGETGTLPASSVRLFILGLGQFMQNCLPDRAGSAVLRSGQTIPFANCSEQDGQFDLQTNDGERVIEAQDVAGILMGGQNTKTRLATVSTSYVRQSGFGAFEADVLQTQAPIVWASYRPRYSPDNIELFKRQFRRSTIDSAVRYQPRQPAYSRTTASHYSRYPTPASTHAWQQTGSTHSNHTHALSYQPNSNRNYSYPTYTRPTYPRPTYSHPVYPYPTYAPGMANQTQNRYVPPPQNSTGRPPPHTQYRQMTPPPNYN